MKFTKQQLLECHPCADGLLFAKKLRFDFAKNYGECERGDWLIWLLRKSGNIDKPQAVTVAIACAEHVLEKFETKYPDDKRPRKAIEAAEAWLANPSEKTKHACAAAYAASADACAAYADACAAACAAAYAADSADSARIKERKWQADKIRELIPNPFKT